MVSSARNAPSSTTVNFGISSAVEISVPRPDFRAQHPQPPGREQAGVQREQVVARGVHQSLGGPHLPADAAAHRVIALAAATARAPAPRSPSAARTSAPRPASPRVSTARRVRSPRSPSRHRGRPSRSRPARRQAPPAAPRPAVPTSRRRPRPTAVPVAGGGPATGWRALPDFTAGEPFQYWPFLTLPTTPEPGATSAFLPTTAPGSSVVRAPMVASLPTVIAADVEVVAVDPVPGQVDLGLDRAAVTQFQHPGHRRGRVQVDALADLVAQRAGVVHQPRRSGQVLRAAGLREPLGEPHPQMHGTAAAIGAGLQARQAASARTAPRCPSGPAG